jgi:hypothetical protein
VSVSAATITTFAITLAIVTVLPFPLVTLVLVVTRAAAGLLGAWVEHFAGSVEECADRLGGRAKPAGDARQEA